MRHGPLCRSELKETPWNRHAGSNTHLSEVRFFSQVCKSHCEVGNRLASQLLVLLVRLVRLVHFFCIPLLLRHAFSPLTCPLVDYFPLKRVSFQLGGSCLARGLCLSLSGKADRVSVLQTVTGRFH